nr:effector protein [Actinomycetota bacterium]
MTAPFERLLQPGSLGPLELRNRIALCPMGVNLGEPDGTAGDDLVAWFHARARGGAGLILVGSASVSYPDGSYDARQVALSDDRFIPGLRRLTDAVRAQGAASAAQLVHDGANSLFDISRGQPLLVPSKRRPPPNDELSLMLTPDELADTMAPFASPSAAYSVRVATDADLEAVVTAFAGAAARAVEAGFDAIEI